MIKRYAWGLVLVLFFLASCISKTENTRLIFDPDKDTDVTFSDFIERAEIIPLETNEDVLFRHINKVYPYNNGYFVSDMDIGIFYFDREGKFKFKVGDKGKGPGEYNYIADFSVNQFTDEIEVLDIPGGIMRYTLQGQFIDRVNLDVQEVSFFLNINSDLVLLFHQSINPFISVYSKSQSKTIKQYIRMPDGFERRRPFPMVSPPFYFSGNDTIIHFGYSTELYKLNGIKLESIGNIDFGTHNFYASDYKWDMAFSKQYYIKKIWLEDRKVFGFQNNFESAYLSIKCFFYNGDYLAWVLNNNTNEYEVIPIKQSLYEMIYGDSKREALQAMPPASIAGTRLDPILNWSSADDFIINAVHPAKKTLTVDPKVLSPKDRELFNEMDLNNNPFLIKYYLKWKE